MHRTTVSLLLLTAALAACADDPSEPRPGPQSQYELTVTGAVTETAAGKAWFGSDTDENGQPIFALLLGEDTSRHVVIAARAGTTRPAPGSYPIVETQSSATDWAAVHILSDDDELLGLFASTAGTLTVTESSAEVFSGTLQFDAAGFMGEAVDSVRVTASFTATAAPAGTQLR